MATILNARIRMNCVACDSWFYVDYDADGRPMHDCPKLGGLSLPLASFQQEQANPGR